MSGWLLVITGWSIDSDHSGP